MTTSSRRPGSAARPLVKAHAVERRVLTVEAAAHDRRGLTGHGVEMEWHQRHEVGVDASVLTDALHVGQPGDLRDDPGSYAV